MALDSVELPGDQGEGVIAQAPADEVLDVLPPEVLVASVGGGLVGVLETADAAADTGYPVVLKGWDADLTHKSEVGAVKLNFATSTEVASAFTAIETAAAGALDGIPVQPQIKGTRELVAGIIRDPSSARA